MDPLKERQKELLGMIVDTYVETVNPVGSHTIAKRYRNAFSPATIRNEMRDLEELEYLTHPHTSAGRIPTDRGYRYYVDHLMQEAKMNARDVKFIAQEYRERMGNMETLIERTSKILSTLSAQAGFVMFPLFQEMVLKRVELTPLGRQHLLVVWVASHGFVQDRVIDMGEEISASELERLKGFLNRELCGLVLDEVKPHVLKKLEGARDSLKFLYQMAHRIVSSTLPTAVPRKLLMEGSGNILRQPEFEDWEKSRRLFKILEAKESLLELVQAQGSREGVQIHIGLEHQCQDIWDCSFVTAEYRLHQKPVGLLGILGPRRMTYNRMVSLVHYVSNCVEEALAQWW